MLFAVAGQKRLQDIIREGKFFIGIGVDETDDPRPSNEYIVTVECLLIPKIESSDSADNARRFHLKLEFPSAVNGHTVSMTLDRVC